jgi:inhibitor of the pro-sigma K processing machinery
MPTNVESKIFVIIILICITLLLIGLIKKRFDLLVNFGLRIMAGLLGIYILNTVIQGFGIDLSVGMNAITTLVIGVLGIPGFVLLYGLAFYFLMTI